MTSQRVRSLLVVVSKSCLFLLRRRAEQTIKESFAAEPESLRKSWDEMGWDEDEMRGQFADSLLIDWLRIGCALVVDVEIRLAEILAWALKNRRGFAQASTVTQSLANATQCSLRLFDHHDLRRTTLLTFIQVQIRFLSMYIFLSIYLLSLRTFIQMCIDR